MREYLLNDKASFSTNLFYMLTVILFLVFVSIVEVVLKGEGIFLVSLAYIILIPSLVISMYKLHDFEIINDEVWAFNFFGEELRINSGKLEVRKSVYPRVFYICYNEKKIHFAYYPISKFRFKSSKMECRELEKTLNQTISKITE
ncbi:hypothetical protein [Jiulongibacter sediminis]|uniref:hypothetical protein n=1 Tax=Jiulongibacter sediminis TaxID=1605367 RepID=UPI0026EA4D93|nr:hypothetical protein [Jiulongibacter sediminis]